MKIDREDNTMESMESPQVIRLTPEASEAFGKAIEQAVAAAVSDRSYSSDAQVQQDSPHNPQQSQSA